MASAVPTGKPKNLHTVSLGKLGRNLYPYCIKNMNAFRPSELYYIKSTKTKDSPSGVASAVPIGKPEHPGKTVFK